MDFLDHPVPHTEAVAFVASKPAVSSEVFGQLLPDLQARVFTVSGIEDINVLAELRDRIAELPLGADWDSVKADVAGRISPYLDTEEAGRAEARAELLLRTHGFQAYQAAQYEVMTRQRAAFPYWQYQTMDDESVRDSHAALDGLVLPADSPFWADHYPPWDWGCRCQVIPLLPEDVADIEEQDAAARPEEKRVLDADRLREMERQGTLMRSMPGDGGLARRFDVRSPATRGTPNPYTFTPQTLRLSATELQARYEPDIWSAFERWAKTITLPETNRTVWDWLNNRPSEVVGRKTVTRVTPAAVAAASKAEPASLPTVPAVRRSPVSAALQVRTQAAHRPHIERAIAAVDRVHDDGKLPAVRVDARPHASAYGTFWSSQNRISVSPGGPWPQMTTAHEIGHLIDLRGLGNSLAYASDAGAELAAFRTAVMQSAAIRGIESRGIYNAAYYLQPREIWARAYAQYIATRSGDVEMLRQLDLIRQTPQIGTLIQWSDADFASIAQAIDNLFRSKGWIA